MPVVDPGFPQGGGVNPPEGGGLNTWFCQFFSKNCMKSKEFGCRRGASLTPPPKIRQCMHICRSIYQISNVIIDAISIIIVFLTIIHILNNKHYKWMISINEISSWHESSQECVFHVLTVMHKLSHSLIQLLNIPLYTESNSHLFNWELQRTFILFTHLYNYQSILNAYSVQFQHVTCLHLLEISSSLYIHTSSFGSY